MLYDGADNATVAYLRQLAPVTVLYIHEPFASEMELSAYNRYKSSARQWGGKPGNYELMIKQGFGASWGVLQVSCGVSSNWYDLRGNEDASGRRAAGLPPPSKSGRPHADLLAANC